MIAPWTEAEREKGTDVTCHTQQPSLTLKIRSKVRDINIRPCLSSKSFTIILVRLLWCRQISHSFTENKWRYAPVETHTQQATVFQMTSSNTVCAMALYASATTINFCSALTEVIWEVGLLMKFIQTAASQYVRFTPPSGVPTDVIFNF